jgi:hypothetical protein
MSSSHIYIYIYIYIYQSEGGSLTGYVVPARVTTLASARPGNSSVVVAVVVAVVLALGPEFANQWE